MSVYWGDLHNHCAVSYGHGTPARALDNARQHLDFCSVTGHAFWPDLPMDLTTQNTIIGMHLGGFAKLQHFWRSLMAQLQAADTPDEFVTFPSYEWHSMEFGDYNCYFDSYDVPLQDAADPRSLAKILARGGPDFMMLPHHGGYVRGYRGMNWDAFDAEASPLVEVFSNHGSGEADDAPAEYHHSMGPRVGPSMLRSGLAAGHRFGFYAGTDSHDGYPGHYGHGRVGVIASRLDRPSIWQALRERRTIATTGANIAAHVAMGDAEVGGVAHRDGSMPLEIDIEGTAPIDRVDLVEGGAGEWRVRRLAGPDVHSEFAPGRFKVKVEMGWGRGHTLSEWNVEAEVRGGTLLDFDTCFRYSAAPLDEERATERILGHDAHKVAWTCRAVPNPAGMMGGTHFNAGGTQAIVLDVEAGATTRLRVRSDDTAFDLSFEDLVNGSVGQHVGGFGSPALKVHRAVPEREFQFRHRETFRPLIDDGFLYVRVLQSDGQVAWVSPIWYA
jgi:hypothetical protein